MKRSSGKVVARAVGGAGLVAAALAAPTVAGLPTAAAQQGTGGANSCSPRVTANAFSDALDKTVVGGVTLGGLSAMTPDRRPGTWSAIVDNRATEPSRIWTFTDTKNPVVAGDPLVLKRPDGAPYDGATADNEGLVVLPGGDYLVSSESEPSIRVFGRDGVQTSALDVPARFGVTGRTPEGEATANATLEGLAIAPSGRQVIAAMEDALSGDGDATLHRFLVYDRDRRGGWVLSRQIAYRAAPGRRVPEVAAYRDGSLLVQEASFAAATGNHVELYAVPNALRATDVTGWDDLSLAPAGVVAPKQFVADITACPSLGATAKQPQINPLLDNYEGMAVTGGRHGAHTVTLISDDNFGATQITRILTLTARLP